MRELNFESFGEEVDTSSIPVIVDFYGENCGACKKFATMLDEIKDQLKYKVKVFKVNVEKEGVLTSRFEIMSLPTIILFNNGKKKEVIIGALPKAGFIKKLEETFKIKL